MLRTIPYPVPTHTVHDPNPQRGMTDGCSKQVVSLGPYFTQRHCSPPPSEVRMARFWLSKKKIALINFLPEFQFTKSVVEIRTRTRNHSKVWNLASGMGTHCLISKVRTGSKRNKEQSSSALFGSSFETEHLSIHPRHRCTKHPTIVLKPTNAPHISSHPQVLTQCAKTVFARPLVAIPACSLSCGLQQIQVQVQWPGLEP